MIHYFRSLALTLLLIAMTFALSAQSTGDILDRRISLEAHNLPIKEVLKIISTQTGIDFSYSDDLVLLPKKVNITVAEKPLKAVLDQLLSGYSIQYKAIGNQVVFQNRKDISKKKVTISGYISDLKNGERLIFASVYDSINRFGIPTNEYGFYSITLPEGPVSLTISYVGYAPRKLTFFLSKDTIINSTLEPKNVLKEVVVTENLSKAANNKMGVEKISTKDIQALPGFLGESDVIKTVQMSSGVKGKEFSNFYVRGGYHDQNLVLLDDAVIYKYSHLGGFYSVFNTDALKSVDLYKGIAPASYGGRLSSVLDIRMREGNNQNFAVSGAIGLLFSHLTVEGPIIKDKMSYIFSARRSYFDLFFPLASNPSSRKNKAYFLDLNVKLNYTLSEKDRLYLSIFNSNDQYSVSNGGVDNSRTSLFYQSRTASFRYNHIFSSKLFSNFSLTNTIFDYGSNSQNSDKLNQELSTNGWKGHLQDYSFKNDYTWYFSPTSTFQFGANFTLHSAKVGSSLSTANSTKGVPYSNINSLENAIYASSKHTFSNKFSVEYGLRLSMHSNIGKSFYYKYAKNDFGGITLTDTINYKRGELYNTHFFIEPRVSFCYNLNPNSSLKFGYNRHTQNIHLISNTTFSTSYDIWYPTTLKVEPQLSDIISTGYFLDLAHHKYSVSVEAYYKDMQHVVDIKEHAQLTGNPFFEDELAFGNAHSYGIELNAHKNTGALTGWMAYTYSRSFMKIPEINNGIEYPSSFDVPHDFSTGLIYRLGKRITLSANWLYSSGTATMLIAGSYRYMNLDVPYYTGKNQGRLPDYHRLDLALTLLTRKTIKRQAEGKKQEASWNFSLINVYNRKNPFYMALHPNNDNQTQAEAVYFYGFIPSVTYIFKL